MLRRRLRRPDLLSFFERLAPCIVAMKACSSAHHWARELVALGHDVRLIPPQYAKPYVKWNKTDAADAEAICEAAGRPTIRFVPIKTKESSGAVALHRVRSLLVRQRTAAVNSARGLLGRVRDRGAQGHPARRRAQEAAHFQLALATRPYRRPRNAPPRRRSLANASIRAGGRRRHPRATQPGNDPPGGTARYKAGSQAPPSREIPRNPGSLSRSRRPAYRGEVE